MTGATDKNGRNLALAIAIVSLLVMGGITFQSHTQQSNGHSVASPQRSAPRTNGIPSSDQRSHLRAVSKVFSNPAGRFGAGSRSEGTDMSAAGPSVINTLDVCNGTLLPGNEQGYCDGMYPSGIAVDSANGDIYVAEEGTNVVTVFSGTTNEVLENISTSPQPTAVAYDSAKNEIFVADAGSNNVTVISGVNNKVIANISGLDDPWALAYDPAQSEVFATDEGSDNVSAISDSNNTVVANIPVGVSPAGIAYDSGKGELFVANYGSENVSVLNAKTGTEVTSISVGIGPDDVAYDATAGEVFVSNGASQNVSVISDSTNVVQASVYVIQYPYAVVFDSARSEVFVATSNSSRFNGNTTVFSTSTNKVVTTIGVQFSPVGLAYDPAKSEILVTNQDSDSVSVISDASNKLIGTVVVGTSPYGIAIDSGNDEIFFANYYLDNVEVLSGATNKVIATVPVGIGPVGPAYDSSNGDIYVTNYLSANVSVISGTTDKVVATIPQQGGPATAAFDSSTNEIFVPNEDTDNVSVISGATNKVVKNITVQADPYGVVYDANRSEVFVSDCDTDNVSVISAINDKVVENISVGSCPSGMALDPSTGMVYVANEYSDNVSVISDSNDTVVDQIAVGEGPADVAIDSATNEVFVANAESYNISLVLDTNNSVIGSLSVGYGAIFDAYDAPNGEVYASEAWQGTVSVIGYVQREAYNVTFEESGLPSGSHWAVTLNSVTANGSADIAFSEFDGSYNFTVVPVAGYTAVPSSGVVTVSGKNVTKSIIFSKATSGKYSVTFSEVGLVKGTLWSVTMSGSVSNSSTTNVLFTTANGTYTFSIGAVAGYTASPLTGSVIVKGANVSKNITFTELSPGEYSLIFEETGLPAGTDWSVTYDAQTTSSTASSIAFSETNGTWSFTVGAISGFSSSPSSGSVTINGATKIVNITFSAVISKFFTMTFTEAGLAAGTSWSVTLNSTVESGTLTALAFANLTNGVYKFSVGAVTGYTSNPTSGSETVSGANEVVSIVFTATSAGEFSLIFREKGLPVGSNWSITYNSQTIFSIASTIGFTEPNGTWSYTIGAVSGYTSSPTSGSIEIKGVSQTVNVTFSPTGVMQTYSITLTESGLVAGTNWSVTLNSTAKYSSSATITFTGISSGSYSYSVGAIEGYTASPAGGTVTVSSANLSKSINFTSLPVGKYSLIFRESGLPVGTNWSVTYFGVTEASTASTIPYTEPNGTWTFTIGPVKGYTPSPETGSITVKGASQIYNITFTKTTTSTRFILTFTETGLPSDTSWSVTVAGVSNSSSTGTITFDEANGTYQYTVGAVSGYSSSPSGGNATIDGVAKGVSITFTSTTSSSSPSGDTTLIIAAGGIIGAVVIVAVVLLLMRKKKPAVGSPPPQQAAQPPAGQPPQPSPPSPYEVQPTAVPPPPPPVPPMGPPPPR